MQFKWFLEIRYIWSLVCFRYHSSLRWESTFKIYVKCPVLVNQCPNPLFPLNICVWYSVALGNVNWFSISRFLLYYILSYYFGLCNYMFCIKNMPYMIRYYFCNNRFYCGLLPAPIWLLSVKYLWITVKCHR